ncbi:MAG: YidC/Oxa1 family membrane protein insertase [Acidimicrobiales bacterium]|jgi:YidC/Oxa1 family membrane protein insertase
MSSLTHAIGGVFQPLLKFIADILAFFYALIPSYPVAVALLTIVVMAALTPLTVKSTKNMAAMQALGPEMKKLQQKYKGPENRTQLNEEMMKLYKEHKVNPASGCLPMLLQMPFFFMLYSVIRGITNTVSKGVAIPYTVTSTGLTQNQPSTCHVEVCADPRYISQNTKMYHDIVAAHGQLLSGGMNFATKLLSHHSSPWMLIPYGLLVAGAVGLQYLQMARLNARNPQANAANPQAAMMQKYMPLIFGFIYLNVAAILNVYFIVSSAIRIGTQEILFRRGMVPGPNAPTASAGGRNRTLGPAKEAKEVKESGVETSERALPKAKGPETSTNGTAGGRSSKASPGTPASGNRSNSSSNGSSNGSNGSSTTEGAAKKHPRSKAKKERKAR